MDKTTFLRRINTPFWLRLFLFWKLPAAWFMGIRVEACDGQQAVVRLPFHWRSQNPFRSTYFAAQCAAAELSTGLLAMAALQGRAPVSMLITNIEGEFIKKAASTLRFICTDGQAVEAAVQLAVETGQAQTLRMSSTGYLPDGTVAARATVTWSFKRRGNLKTGAQ